MNQEQEHIEALLNELTDAINAAIISGAIPTEVRVGYSWVFTTQKDEAPDKVLVMRFDLRPMLTERWLKHGPLGWTEDGL